MTLTRRNLLKRAGATGAALVLSEALSPLRAFAQPAPLRKFTDPLRLPPILDGTRPVALTMVNARHRFHSGLSEAHTLAYRVTTGTPLVTAEHSLTGYLGPIIVVPTGTTTRISTTNAIGSHPLAASIDEDLPGTLSTDASSPRTALHVHGGNSAPQNDGGPLDTFRPGAGRTYTYDNDQDAAGLWFHDHALAITRLNVYAGLAGGYLVRDTSSTGIDTGDGRHLPAPPYEIPLVLQDRTFTATGGLFYPEDPWEPEFFGTVAVVNGVAFPHLEVDRGIYRFRLYNGSNARFYRLSLKLKDTGATLPFRQIGSEGGLFNTPVRLAHLLIAPGERADLLVDFRRVPAGTVVEMRNNAVVPFPSGSPAAPKGGVPLRQIMQFRVTTTKGWTGTVPDALRPVTRVVRLDTAAATAKVRAHSLVEVADPTTDEVVTVTLDNRRFQSLEYQSQVITPGTLEVWELANTTADTHPIHLHLVQFQVLDRQPFDAARYLADHYAGADGVVRLGSGPYPAPSPHPYLLGRRKPPAPNEMGWKDTVQAPPGMVTRIAVPFGSGAVRSPVASRNVYSGDYVWHCHILEHEDNDMMQRYRIG